MICTILGSFCYFFFLRRKKGPLFGPKSGLGKSLFILQKFVYPNLWSKIFTFSTDKMWAILGMFTFSSVHLTDLIFLTVVGFTWMSDFMGCAHMLAFS